VVWSRCRSRWCKDEDVTGRQARRRNKKRKTKVKADGAELDFRNTGAKTWTARALEMARGGSVVREAETRLTRLKC
jgi:hypothetical protein